MLILEAFEESGWPEKIDDPLPPGTLRHTIKDLQKSFEGTPITFGGDGTGEGVCWRAVTAKGAAANCRGF